LPVAGRGTGPVRKTVTSEILPGIAQSKKDQGGKEIQNKREDPGEFLPRNPRASFIIAKIKAGTVRTGAKGGQHRLPEVGEDLRGRTKSRKGKECSRRIKKKSVLAAPASVKKNFLGRKALS